MCSSKPKFLGKIFYLLEILLEGLESKIGLNLTHFKQKNEDKLIQFKKIKLKN
jgi:hypothetical protein